MSQLDVLCVVGARPNFIKIAPLMRSFLAHGGFRPSLVHTGQHYDPLMNDVFFRDLDIPSPDIHLGVGSGSHSEQTARIMMGFEAVVRADRGSPGLGALLRCGALGTERQLDRS